MKILFFLDSPWDTHHAYIIDEIKIAIEDGHEVTLITCDAEFEACRFNPTGNKLSCGICKKYQKESVQLLPPTLITFPLKHFLTETDKKEIQSQQFTYNSIEDIKNLTFEGVDIGYGSFSTYIDFTRNLSPIFNKKFKKYFDKLLRSSLITLKGMRKAFKTIQPDKVVVRNGRHHQNRPLLRLAEQKNLIFDTLEHIIKNPNDVRKEIYHNSLPHGVRYNNDTALKNWNNSELSEEEKIQKGSSFFEKRINGELVADVKIYTKEMVKGAVPESWDNNKKNISIFISSEDEFYALGGEWAEGIYPSQLEGIKQIISCFESDDHYHFYLRVHPNLSNIKYSYHLDCLKLNEQFNNITVIPGNSKINTYDLIKKSDQIISFGSSVGIEATFLGIPSILAGNCYYKYLGGTYNPKNHQEAIDLIKSDLKPLPKLAAYIYGFYLMREGIFHKYFNPNFKTKQFKLLGLKLNYKVNYREEGKSPLRAIWRYSERYRIFGLPYYIPYRFGVNLVPDKGE